MDKLLDKLEKSFESQENLKGLSEYFKRIVEQEAIKEKRFQKFDEWILNNDFDTLLYRLILEHDEDYREKCYHNGYEPFMNNKLSFVFEHAMKRGKRVRPKELACDFPSIVSEFKGFYFETVFGQGSVNSIYNKNDLKQIY